MAPNPERPYPGDQETSPGSRLLGPGDVRVLADEIGLRPTKQHGQNFVTDGNTIRRIVRHAGVGASDVVLEIGPGLGSLTLGLLETGARVTAVELDERLADALPSTIRRYASGGATAGESPRGGAATGDTARGDTARGDTAPGDGAAGAAVDRLTVLQADALRLEEVPGPPPTVLVANLPYNVAVPVLLRMLERCYTLRSGLVMVQLEVAERLAAAPGSKVYGVPTAKTAWYADVQLVGQVPRAVFWPQPNVDSGLVALTRREPPATDVAREQVFAVVDAAFAQRRKVLRGALAPLAGSAAAAERALVAAGLDPTDRGERLGIVDFARLAEALQEGTGEEPREGRG